MTQKHLLTILLLLSVATLQAQMKWHYGPTFSVNFGNIDGKGMRPKMIAGIQAGGFAQLVLNGKWSIQPEIVYTDANVNKGSDYLTYYNVDGRVDAITNMQLNYISVPVLVRYDLNKKLAFMVGPQYGYLFHTLENLAKDGSPAFKKNNISANAEVQYSIGNAGFFVRYNQGISNINDIDDRYKWRTTNLQFGTAVKIR